MATPLFIADEAALKAELRLTGIDAGTDAQAILDSVVVSVRTSIYSRLGIATVGQILATTYNPAFTTEPEILRAAANTLEVRWVWLMLLSRLPMVFMDNSGGSQEIYNEEGVFRSFDPDQLDTEAEKALLQIEQLLALLSGEQTVGEVGLGQAFTQADQQPRMFPGGSLVGENDRLTGDPTRRVDGFDG